MTPCGSCGKRVLGVFQGAVDAFSASTAPAASTGRAHMLAPNDVVTFVEPGDQHSAEVDRPNAIVDFLKTNRVWREGVGMKSSRFLKRKVPALVMRLTRKCPGYSIGRSRASYARGEGR